MCAIVGMFSDRRDEAIDTVLLRRMRDMLTHRGPDDAGEFVNGSVGLGHRRLSIIDLVGGRQPLCNEDGSVQVVFNGEIYNFRELQQEVVRAGHRLATRTDTEVIVHLYEQYGDGVVEHLSGMFAFALWDQARRRLLLARDRAGIKPLFYAWRDGRFAFASEIGPLLLLPWVSREIDPRSLDDYLARGYVPAPRTMFRDVHKVPAGHILMVDGDRLSQRRYWQAQAMPGIRGDVDELASQLVTELDHSVHRHLVSDVPLGAFLSGGLDSSIVVALMRRHCAGPLKTFSVRVAAGAEFDESEYARLVARRFETEHHEVVLSSEQVPALLEMAARHLDEPISDPAVVPTYLLAKLARESVTVVLTGEGADEAFGGYDVFRKAMLVANYRRVPSWLRRAVTDPLLRQIPMVHAGERLVEASRDPAYLAQLLHLQRDTRRNLYTDGCVAALAGNGNGAEAGAALDSSDPFGSVFRDLIDSHLAERLLAKVDRMTMAHSLEARVPFLDPRVIEFALALPARLKVRGRTTKYLLRRAFRDILPPVVTRRRKHAFNLPCSAWLRSSLAPLVEEVFAKPVLADLIDADQQRAMWRRHVAGDADLGTEIWALLTLEFWARYTARG